MTQEQYYKAPSQEMFDDIKRAALATWDTMDDTYGYVTGKKSRIKDLENISDNAWTMVAMFDQGNQRILLSMVQPETRMMILDAMSEN